MLHLRCAVLFQRSALESCVKGWGVSVLVGWTDMHDFSARPIQLIAGRTWKGSLFGGNTQTVSDRTQDNSAFTRIDPLIAHPWQHWWAYNPKLSSLSPRVISQMY